jgi:hypothetical protein
MTLCAAAASFEASDVFEGCRPCMVFKLGDRGLGYYRDAPANVNDLNICTDREQTEELVKQTEALVNECDSHHGLAGISYDAISSQTKVVCVLPKTSVKAGDQVTFSPFLGYVR